MFDISMMANIAEIGGGIAILVSLWYVGYQIRQSNRIASASALQSVLDRFADRTLNQYVEHPELSALLIRGHQCKEDFAIKDRVIFDAWILREVLQMQNIMQLHTRGLLSSVDYETWLAFTAAQIKTPGGTRSWQLQKVSLTPTIVKTMEAYLKKNPEAPSLIQLYPELYSEDGYPTSDS